MKWSLLVGRFWGTEIRLHITMLLLVPYVLVTFRPEGVLGAARLLLLVAAVFACVALHEMGHTLAAKAFGIQVKSIVLWPLGGFASLSRRPQRVLHDILLSAAGPVTNLLLACLLAVLTVAEILLQTTSPLPRLSGWLEQWKTFPFLVSLLIANLSLALFNLVPVYPLDGGQIARNLLKLAFGEKRADALMMIFSLPLALGLTLLGLFTGDALLGLTGLLLLLAGATLSIGLLNWVLMGVLYFADRAGYYLKRQDLDAALREYTLAIDRTPDRPSLYVNRAVAHMNLMDLFAARADVDRALALDEANPLAWVLRGELLGLEKDHEGALKAFNRAIELKPNWAIAFLDRACLYQEQGDLDRALQEMNHAVDLGNNTSVACFLRSIARFQAGDISGAQADAAQVLRYAPRWMLVFPEVFLDNLKGHLDWAAFYYNRAVEEMPQAYQAYQGRADAFRVNDRSAWAISDYERAIRLAPAQAELYLNRGRAYLQMHMPDLAAQDFRQAARIADRRHIRRKAEELLRSLA